VAALAKQTLRINLIEHKEYIARKGGDVAEIRGWKWPY
jgi:xylulose-5-phosphate/fructose-6-phosphate phosphoketolase